MNLFVLFSQMIVALPPLDKQASQHSHDNEGNCRGKPHALRDLFLPHWASLFVDIVSKDVFVDHESSNFRNECLCNEISDNSYCNKLRNTQCENGKVVNTVERGEQDEEADRDVEPHKINYVHLWISLLSTGNDCDFY